MLDYFDRYGFYILFLGLPGVVLLIGGIRAVVTGKTIGFPRPPGALGWGTPGVIRGEDARRLGKIDIALGVLLLVAALLIAISDAL
jgi:hypothetical protein